MRKIFGFLLAAFFITGFSQTVLAQATTVFTAEVSMAGAGTFGFELRHKSDGSLPTAASSGTVVNTLTWEDVPNMLSKAGTDEFVNSYTYALITNDLSGAQKVYIYTDNVKDSSDNADYKIHIDSAANVSSLVETLVKGDWGTGVRKIDLAYRILDTNTYGVAGAGGGAAANIADIQIGVEPIPPDYNAYYGTDFALDKRKSLQNNGRGRVIANVDGNWVGAGWYNNYANVLYFMFFSANFQQARRGYLYGTNSLTVELEGQP
ncbi:MAG: hypothetical protein LBQ47_06060 [Endomicrobium sp.]|jgi:hypothetical protein|nr:hypothetical protein [Endomicrobium sp.]